MSTEENPILSPTAERLNSLLVNCKQARLEPALANRFAGFCALLLRWNARVNLTAIRDEEGILARHFVESIACARALPGGIGSLLDFGSGAGFPGVPIALCRPEIVVTLAESQGKKSAFLQEAVRVAGISARVYSGRAETLGATFDCVILRAVDRMEQAVKSAAGLVRPGGWLAPMTTAADLERLQAAAGTEFTWHEPLGLPGGESRILVLGQRGLNSPA